MDDVVGRRALRGRLLIWLASALSAGLCVLVAAAAANAETVTRSFFAQEEPFVVPQGVSSVQLVAIGGRGGSDGSGIAGGQGAGVHGELSVTPGETLYVHVGGNGASGKASWERGEGGHSSDVRSRPLSAGLSPDPRLIVAGAGGGVGGQGHGGGLLPGSQGGNAEEEAPETLEAFGGGGGTQTGGGEGGFGQCSSGESGRLEVGGAGGFCPENSGLYGGDGGDGYYGGGGGGTHGHLDITHEGEPGGGGGSSLVPPGGARALSAETPQVRVSYTQPPNPPAVVTGAASEVAEFAATLNATVNPEDQAVTSCAFEYGTSEGYGATAPCSSSPGSGVTPVPVSANLTGLLGATTYHYRIVASNGGGTSFGADRAFTTPPQEPPTVTGVGPSGGPLGGGTMVTITGTNLNNATAVGFGSTAAASYTVESPTTIRAVSPAGTAGTVDVTVATPGGTSPTSAEDRYMYIAPPTASTLPATGITRTTAVLNGSVSSTAAFTDCHFEYGTSASYGGSAPCSTMPGAGTSSVSAGLSGLTPNTTYHFRVSVSNAGGTTAGGDEAFETTGAPEYGRCIKVTAGTGVYGSSSCTATGGERKYEWYPAFGGSKPLVKTHFTLAIKEKSTLQLQTFGPTLYCTGQTGAGEYSGNKTVANVTLRFTGCYFGTEAQFGTCRSSGAAEGEVLTTALHGELGVIKTSTEGPAKNVIGTDLKPVSGKLVSTLTCGTKALTITGSVIGEVKRNAMTSKAPIKFTHSNWAQKPTRFEGASEDVLVTQIAEQAPHEAGLGLVTNQIDEEKVEVNSVV